jgi:hypothetical protein
MQYSVQHVTRVVYVCTRRKTGLERPSVLAPLTQAWANVVARRNAVRQDRAIGSVLVRETRSCVSLHVQSLSRLASQA